jgi:phospholipid-translocating ATPase
MVCTFILYLVSIIVMRQYFDWNIIDFLFLAKVLAISAISWCPIHFLKWLMKKIDPTDYNKIMRGRRNWLRMRKKSDAD